MSISITQLNNGFRIVTDTVSHVETVSMGIWVNAGTRHETQEVNGISHFLEHMAFKGTARRTAQQIAEEIENVGGYLNAYTGREQTAYYGRVLKGDSFLLLDILSDILQNSTFDQDEFEKERSVILQEIGQTLDTPDDIIFDYLQEKCFPGQSMGWPILGTPEIIGKLMPETLKDYMSSHYSPDQMILSAAGAIDHDALVEKAMAFWDSVSSFSRPSDAKASYQGGVLEIEKDLEQAHVALAYEAVPYGHPYFYAFTVLTTVLGGGMSSRLFQEIREKRGLAYTIQSHLSPYQDTGLLTIYAGTSKKQVEEMMQIVQKELQNLPGDLQEIEIQRAKAQIKSGLLMSLESMGNRCEQMASHLSLYGRVLSVEELTDLINNVDLKQVKSCSSKLLEGKMTHVVLKPY